MRYQHALCVPFFFIRDTYKNISRKYKTVSGPGIEYQRTVTNERMYRSIYIDEQFPVNKSSTRCSADFCEIDRFYQ